MNCPSRTDEVEWTPGWNQNPAWLAADLTTRQDLNGLINARELKRDRRAGSPKDESLDDEYRLRLSQAQLQPARSSFWSWALWLLSVFCTSLLISNLNVLKFSNVHLPDFSRTSETGTNDQSRVRLSKRSSCASGGVSKDEYDTPLHVGALFIILFVSTTGCAFPMLVLRFPRLRIPASFLFTVRHFGTGVLIATAFVHLLPTAFISLGNPCLSSFWTTDYPAMPGAIALAAIFLLTIIEMSFSPGRSMCSGGHGDIERVKSRPQRPEENTTSDSESERPLPASRPSLPTVVDGSSPLRDMGPLFGRTASFSRTLARIGEQSRELDQKELEQLRKEYELKQQSKSEEVLAQPKEDHHNHEDHNTAEQMHKRAVMQCLLLEMGILFHSVFIGMSLSVSVGSDFVVLLIAIVFHQTFEGLALGARIASLKWPEGAYKPWIMAFAYGCTTPIGQAIGLAVHTLYTPDSEVGLLVVGIMNAISAGLLAFASLVELLSEDFLSDESWRILRGKKRVYACLLVFFGAFGMSLVGAWA